MTQAYPPRPLGIALLVLLQIWNGLWYLIITFILLAVSSSAGDEEDASGKAGIIFILAVAYFGLCIFSFWLARGYVKGQEWARRRGMNAAELAIVLVFIGLLVFKGQLFVPDSPFWTILGNVVIVWYLRRDNVKKYFASRRTSRVR